MSTSESIGAPAATYTSSVKVVWLNRALFVLACLGLFIAGVLSIGKLPGFTIPCIKGSDGCEIVSRSSAGALFGIPVAFIGVFGYLALAVLAAIRSQIGFSGSNRLVLIGYAISAIGTAFSAYLQYQAIFVVSAFCPWCLASASLMLVNLIVYAFLAQAIESNPDAKPDRGATDLIAIVSCGLVLLIGLGIMVSSMHGEVVRANTMLLDSGVELPSNIRDIVTVGGHREGPTDAAITIVEFADLQCPACQATTPKVAMYQAAHPKSVELIFHHFPLPDRHQFAVPAAALSEFAATKGKFWDFTLAVMSTQKEAESADDLYQIGRSVGLDMAEMKAHATNPQDPTYAKVTAEMKLANSLGLRMTPTYFIFVKGDPKPQMTASDAIMELLTSPKYMNYLK